MDRGVRIGIDVGKVRIGVAASDPDATMAFPVATVTRDDAAVQTIADMVAEREACAVFVGRPGTLAGGSSASTSDAEDFAAQLAERVDAAVRLVDERLSTVSASRALQEAGRNTRRQRDVIDQASAVVILDSALDIDRRGNLSTVTVEVARKGSHD